jgi:signal transduction histidine kinase/HAMP domain-containing protein
MRFRDLRLATKQAIAFGLILVIMAGVSWYATQQVYQLRKEINDVNNNWLPRMISIANLNLNASWLRISQLQHAMIQNPDHEKELIEVMLGLIDAIEDNRDTFEALMNDSTRLNPYSEQEKQLYQEFDALWGQYQDQFFTLFTMYEMGEKQEAISLLNGASGEVFEAFSRDLRELVELNKNAAADAARRAGVTYRSTRDITTGLFVGTILLTFVFAMGLLHHVMVPVRQLDRAAGYVAQGFLNVELDDDRKDEFGRLARSFNHMTRALREARDQTERQAAALLAANSDLEQQKAETEQKNKALEEALERLQYTQQQLLVKEKLASLGQLTAGIAHEIKNPLNFVNNFALLTTDLTEELEQILTSQPDRPISEVLDQVQGILSDLQFNAQKIAEHGKRADGIVKSMLLHSRGKGGERGLTDVNALVDEYVNLAYHGKRATDPMFSTKVERELDPAVGQAYIVPQDIGRVLLNLLNNAFYAVQQKAPTVRNGYEPTVRVITKSVPNGIEISIQDNGCGLTPEVRERIFEPFFTTKPTGSGTGLGLSLSYDIVVQGHGGAINVTSTPNEGSTFTVTLPT